MGVVHRDGVQASSERHIRTVAKKESGWLHGDLRPEVEEQCRSSTGDSTSSSVVRSVVAML